MQNTWSIGRTWKPREGVERLVLTDEKGNTNIPTPGGWTASSSCKRHQTAMSIVWPQDETSTYPRPLSGSQAATGRQTLASDRIREDFAAAAAPCGDLRPIRTRKLRPWVICDGTAPDRVWEEIAAASIMQYRKPLEHTRGAFPYIRHPRVGCFSRPWALASRASPGPPRGRLPLKEGSQKPLGPRRDTPAGAQYVLGGNPLNTR